MCFALDKFKQEEVSVFVVLKVGMRGQLSHERIGSTFVSRRKPRASMAEVNAEISSIRLVTSAIFSLPLVTVSLPVLQNKLLHLPRFEHSPRLPNASEPVGAHQTERAHDDIHYLARRSIRRARQRQARTYIRSNHVCTVTL